MDLRISKLSKTYPNGTKALDDVSINIKKGMFGLLGPNGAGKSTLMRTIATLQMPDEGEVTFNEVDILKNKITLRKQLGYLPQEFGVYARTSAERLLNYLAQLKGVSDKKERSALINYCLEVTNLSDVRKKSVSGYSGGMKQRFGIAQLLLNKPKLIIVDEPTAGLDPAERQRFLNILREIGKEHVVIFSTHIVEDIKDLCTDMAVMKDGKILSHCKPIDALAVIQHKIYTKDITEGEIQDIEGNFNLLASSYNLDNTIKIRVYSESPLDSSFRTATPTLEDYYFTTLNRKNV